MHLVLYSCDNQVHLKQVELHSQLFHVSRYLWTCDWNMFGVWFEVDFNHLLIRHLSRKHCFIFPASTTISKLTSPSEHLTSVSSPLFSRFSWTGRSAGCRSAGCQHPHWQRVVAVPLGNQNNPASSSQSTFHTNGQFDLQCRSMGCVLEGFLHC